MTLSIYFIKFGLKRLNISVLFYRRIVTFGVFPSIPLFILFLFLFFLFYFSCFFINFTTFLVLFSSFLILFLLHNFKNEWIFLILGTIVVDSPDTYRINSDILLGCFPLVNVDEKISIFICERSS